MAISWYNVSIPGNPKAMVGAVPFIPPPGKSNRTPGDSHVAALLGMTWWVSLRFTIQPGVTPPTSLGGGHLPSRGGLRVVTWYRRDGGPVPYAPRFLNYQLSTIHYPLSTLKIHGIAPQAFPTVTTPLKRTGSQ